MGTQTEIAKQIVAKKADYVLALKANHPTVYSQIQQWFETEKANNFIGVDVRYDKRIEKAHHRTEIREVWTVRVAAIGQLYQPKVGAGLQSQVMVVRVRHLWNKTTREAQFYLTSLHSDAQLIGRAIRKHWGIENEAHWTQGLYFCVRCLSHSFKPQSSKFCPFTTLCSQCSRAVNRPINVVSVKK